MNGQPKTLSEEGDRVMDIQTFKEALPYLIKAKVPAMLVGHHGVGKTEGTRQFSQENDYMLRILNLGTQEVGDVIGLADFLKDPKTGQNVATKFMIPTWAKDLKEFCEANPDKHGILFLDELNRARRDVLQVVFPLLLEGRIHETIFPKNFYVLAAMNPNTENYIVTDISDKALLDRFCHIKMAPSKQEFFGYAKSRGFDPNLVQFLQDQPALLQGELEEFGIDDVTPSRRSWELIDRLLKLKPPVNLLRHMAVGLVGSQAATAMLKALSDGDKPINAKDVIDNYSKFEKKIKEYSNPQKNRMDMLKFTTDSLVEWAKATPNAKLTPEQQKNIAAFLYDVPRELSFDVCRELYAINCTRPVIDECAELLNDIAAKRGMKTRVEKK